MVGFVIPELAQVRTIDLCCKCLAKLVAVGSGHRQFPETTSVLPPTPTLPMAARALTAAAEAALQAWTAAMERQTGTMGAALRLPLTLKGALSWGHCEAVPAA